LWFLFGLFFFFRERDERGARGGRATDGRPTRTAALLVAAAV
jgi:hypothetical protein